MLTFLVSSPPVSSSPISEFSSLTRIDTIVQEALQVYTAGYRKARGRVPPPPSATDLALQIDPIRLLDDLVGAILAQLHAAVPTADLAVSLTSAWGLQGSGWGWSPFGVREALLFLATGKCREPVVRYAPNAVEENDASSWIEIPSAFSPPGDDR